MLDLKSITEGKRKSMLNSHINTNKDRKRALETQIAILETVISDNTARLNALRDEYQGLSDIQELLTDMAGIIAVKEPVIEEPLVG